jgi:hypothetical protein
VVPEDDLAAVAAELAPFPPPAETTVPGAGGRLASEGARPSPSYFRQRHKMDAKPKALLYYTPMRWRRSSGASSRPCPESSRDSSPVPRQGTRKPSSTCATGTWGGRRARRLHRPTTARRRAPKAPPCSTNRTRESRMICGDSSADSGQSRERSTHGPDLPRRPTVPVPLQEGGRPGHVRIRGERRIRRAHRPDGSHRAG